MTESSPRPGRSEREYPDRPWVGVGVIAWRGERVLLIRRGKAPRQGTWSLPGGAQHLGETVFQTAVREMREETGLAVTPYEVVTVVDAVTRDGAGAVQYHYTLVEVAAEAAGEGEAVCADDALEACWATVEEAAALVPWDETAKVIRLSAARRCGR
ncbi:NUDIX hydrolase [Azospirillum sp. ST 5-10]|uniref:NUDIX hydrolase n=1 Tax=unclassified Azospirillum TaxID=2630922 RepID=UPI003F49D30F